MAVHNRVQRTDRQPAGDGLSNRIRVDETTMQVGGERNWLCAAVDPVTEGFADTLFQTRTVQLTSVPGMERSFARTIRRDPGFLSAAGDREARAVHRGVDVFLEPSNQIVA